MYSSAFWRYGAAAAAVLAGTLLRMLLDPWLGDNFPFATVFLAVLVSAWYGGFGPALAASALGAAASLFLLPPRGSVVVAGLTNQLGLALYLAVSLGISVLGGGMRSARQRAEQMAQLALTQREHLRTTLASIGDAVIVTDVQGRVTSLNAVAEQLTGWTMAEAAGQLLPAVFRTRDPASTDPAEDPVARVLAQGRSVGTASGALLHRRDGTERFIDDSASPIRNAAGQVTGVVLVFRDATERRRAEGELYRQKEWFRITLSSIGDAVIATDTNGCVTFMNGVAQSLTGWTQEEAHGRALESVFRIVNEYSRQAVENPVSRALREGAVVGLANHTVLIARNGAERPIADSAAPIEDERGTVAGVVLVFRDVTADRRADETRRRLAAVVESSDDAIYGKALEGIVTSWNKGAERLYGYSAEEMVGQSVSRLVPPERMEELAAIMEKVARREVTDHFETIRLRKDGRPVEVSVSISPIVDSAGQVIGASSIARDITRRKEDEAEIRRLNRDLQLRISEFEKLLEVAPIGIAVAADAQCRQIWTNQYLATLLRIDASRHAPGTPAAERPAGYQVFHNGRLLSESELPLQSAASTGRDIRGMELQVVLDDGTELRLLASAAPLYDEQERVRGAIFAGVDIGERVKAEEQVRRSEQELSEFFENAAVGIHWVGPDGTILRVNRTELEMLGYSREEYLGHNIAEFHVDPPVLEQILERLGRGETVGNQEALMRCKDGSVKHVVINSNSRLEGGRLLHTRCFTRDITEQKRAQEALARSEQRYRQIVETANEGIWLIDSAGATRFANPRMPGLLGCGPGDLQGRSIWDFLDLEGRREMEAQFRRLKEGVSEQVQMRFRRNDGGELWALVSSAPVLDASGRFDGALAMISDLSEWKSAEQSLRDSEQRLQLALSAGRMGTWEWHIPSNRVAWSPGIEAIHGMAPGTFAGNFEAYKRDIHPDDLERVLHSIRETVEQGKEHRVEYRIVWPDSSQHWVEGRGMLFRDANGKPVRVIGVCMDIDARKRTEHTTRFLADASATLAAVVDYESTLQKVARLAVPFFADWCAVDMLDEEGGLRCLAVAHADPAKVEMAYELRRRFPPDRRAPHGVWHVIRTGKAEIVREISEEMLCESIRDPEHLRLIRELRVKSYIGVPLAVRGKVLGVLTFIGAESGRRYEDDDLAVAEDLAHRAAVAVENAQLYRALKEADRRKDEFLALLGHELRNPLAPVRNALHVLKLPGCDPAIAGRALATMERQVEHMIRLVDDLLDVSRIMRGKVELRREPLDLAVVIARAVETAQPAIEAEKHQLSVALSSEPVWVNGDLVRLAQVVANLLNNAAKYTARDGKIVLAAGREGDHAVVRVRDNGVGIPADQVSRIFELFTQLDRSPDRSRTGLGVGLTVVKNLVELHGGSVDAHSAGPGQGSEFVVRLPLLETHQEKLGSTRRKRRATGSPARRRLLVVDDNVDAADTLAMLLRLQGQDVTVAYDGASATAAAEAEPPDVAFLDLGMPVMDGFQLARWFRSHPTLNTVVLVALTGWGQPEDRQRTKEAGFDHHLVKPVDEEDLRRLLGRVTARGATG